MSRERTCILIKFYTALKIINSVTRVIVFMKNILQSCTKDIVIQTEIKAQQIIFLSLSSCCWSTCQLRDENMREKSLYHVSHIHLVVRVQCRELWQGLMVRTCPTAPAREQQAWGSCRGTTNPGHQASVSSRISHRGHVCVLLGWVPAGQTGGDWDDPRTKLPPLGTVTWHQWGYSRWVFVFSSWSHSLLERVNFGKHKADICCQLCYWKTFFFTKCLSRNWGKKKDHRMSWTWEQCPISSPTRDALEVPAPLRVLDGHLKDKCLTSAVSFDVWVLSFWTLGCWYNFKWPYVKRHHFGWAFLGHVVACGCLV